MANKTMHHLVIEDNNYEILDAKNRANIAAEYSASSTYKVGDVVLYNGQLYKCTTAITTAEAWTAAHWTAVTVGGELSSVKDGLQAKFGFKSQTNASLFDADDVYNSSSIAWTRRWFANHVFNSGDVIDDISYAVSQDSALAITVYTEIWEENSGTLTKVFSDSKNVKAQTVQSGTVVTYHVASDYTVQKKAYVCFCMAGSRNPIPYTADSAGNDNVLVSTDVDPTTETLALSSLSTFPIKLIPSITISYTAYVGVNVVTIGDGMDYEEIQDALVAINDDTATNPYTFWLMPKSTPYKPFSMLRNSFTDNYPWSGIRTRNISIIGMDKAHCVIRSDSGNYKLPCGEPLTNGVIKNVTFVMTNDDQDPNATQGGYCLHIDCKPLNDMGYKMIIEDCDFENSSGPCVGIGVHANCDLQFRNCHFDTTLSAEYNPHEGYRNLVDYGVVYAHTSTATTAPDQHLTIEDCVGVCVEGSKSLRIDKTTQYDPETSSFVYTLIRNVFWNETLNAAGYGISGSLTADAKNFGNNNV